jgi:hypothetical protein
MSFSLQELNWYILNLKTLCKSKYLTERSKTRLKTVILLCQLIRHRLMNRNQLAVEQLVELDDDGNAKFGDRHLPLSFEFSGEGMAYSFGYVRVEANCISINGASVGKLGFDQKTNRERLNILDQIINLLKTLKKNLFEIYTCYDDEGGDCTITMTEELSNTLKVFDIFVSDKFNLDGKVQETLMTIPCQSPVADKLRSIPKLIVEIRDLHLEIEIRKPL